MNDMLQRMAGRSYPQVDGGPSDVLLELGRLPNTPSLRALLLMPLVACALFGWLIFFLPWPLYVTVPVLLAAYLFMIAMPLVPRLLPPCALTTQGVRNGLGLAPWSEVQSYTFTEPNGLSLVVVGHTLNIPEDIFHVYCPPELREQALAVLQQFAPRAQLLGRMPT